jgi:hypothetical protein
VHAEFSKSESKSAISGGMNINTASTEIFGLLTNNLAQTGKYCGFPS